MTLSTSLAHLWCYSLDGETYNSGTFATRQAAINSCVKTYDPEPGANIHVAKAERPDLHDLVDVDDLIDGMVHRAGDIGGEYADGFPGLTCGVRKELSELIVSYLTPHCSITFYSVSDAETHTITLADLEYTAREMDMERAAAAAQ